MGFRIFNELRGKSKYRGTAADPGFQVGGSANPPLGTPLYDLAKFSQKLRETKKILDRGRPLDLPMQYI